MYVSKEKLSPLNIQCPNKGCEKINTELDVTELPCYHTLIEGTVSTYKIQFPCKFCRKDVIAIIDNTYPTLAQLLLGIADEMYSFQIECANDIAKDDVYWGKIQASQEQEILLNEIEGLRCKTQDIDNDNRRIADTIEKQISSWLGEKRLEKLDKESLKFLRESMFKIGMLKRFITDEFKEKFATEWGSLSSEMIKVFENELKIRLKEFLAHKDSKESNARNWKQKAALGDMLFFISNYDKNTGKEKELLDQSTTLHRNKKLLASLKEINNKYRNPATHTASFSEKDLMQLYEIMFEEKKLAKFVDCLPDNQKTNN